MKKTILGALAFSVLFSCSNSLQAVSVTDKDAQLCEAYAKLAKQIMTNRQHGLPMSVDKKPDDSNVIQAWETSNAITIAAYERPRMHTEKNIQREIEDFRNEIYLACIKKLSM